MIKAQQGTKLPTAPKAEDRYANSIRLYANSPRFKYDIRYQDGQTTGVVQDTPYTTLPAIITQQVVGNDTVYRETPDQKRFSLRGFPVTRTATNTDSNRQEFETMRRRFNTAWGVAKHEEGSKIKQIPFNQDPKITYKTPEFVPTYNKTVPEVNVISAKLPGVEVTAPDLSKTQRFPYGGINVVSKSINGGLDRKQRTFVNPFEGHDLVASKQEGGLIERSDNTRVQKPIPGMISPDSEVRTYDNIPVRVSKHYPWQDKYYLGNPARPMYSRDKNVKLNGIYPSVYGVELDVLAPEYIQKINGNDTTYYVQGGDKNYYPVAGQQDRPAFKEAFKNPKARGNRPNYFDTPEKIDKVKQVIANQQK